MTKLVEGLCQCGCGQPTTLWKYSNPRQGRVAGTYARYRKGHAARVSNPMWKGGRIINKDGYALVRVESHPRCSPKFPYVLEHILVVEAAMGKPLPVKAAVHHVNGVKDDNRPENLVVCPDHAYHMLLHQRQRSLDACGRPDFLYCRLCQTWDSPSNLMVRKRTGAMHRACANAAQREKCLSDPRLSLVCACGWRGQRVVRHTTGECPRCGSQPRFVPQAEARLTPR